MNTAIEFAFLGLGAGAVYAMLSQGLVLIYRGSGVLNFAQGAVAMVGAYVFYELQQSSWPFIPALLVAVMVGATLGALIHLLIMRSLKQASPLVRVIATLGIVTILQSVATLRYEDRVLQLPPQLPHGLIDLGNSIAFPADRLWLCGIATAITAVLWAWLRFTTFGLAITAAAENEQTAATLGWSPDVLATVSWVVGSGLAALAGVLLVPITGLQVTTLTLLTIPAMAAGLLGSFRALFITLIAAFALGIAQSELTRWVTSPGWPQAAPLVAIIAVLVVRGTALPLRSHVLERLPALGSGHVNWRVVTGVVALVVALCLWVFDTEWLSVVAATSALGLFLLSVVVVTGYAGQLSLAQVAFGGIGALITFKLVVSSGWPFELALAAGIVGTTLVGIVFAIPALRTRGINLAVVTLSLSFAVYSIVFTTTTFTGGELLPGPQTLFGIKIDALQSPASYALFAVGCFVISALAVTNIRRGTAGRRLIAVRANERAAASLGINVVGAKIYAFAVSAAIAGLAGIVTTMAGYSVTLLQFGPLRSIEVTSLAVVGGVGFVIGPLLGATLGPGSVGSLISNSLGIDQNWLTLVGGVVLILLLIMDSNGVASYNSIFARTLIDRFAEKRRGSSGAPRAASGSSGSSQFINSSVVEGAEPDAEGPIGAVSERAVRSEQTLRVDGLTVEFGTVKALSAVDLVVSPGEVVGVIGPNGAGKTTLIDAITGFVSVQAGDVHLGARNLNRFEAHRRARAGVTRTFQSLELFDDLTVAGNLQAAADPRDALAYFKSPIWPERTLLPVAVHSAIEEFGLADSLERLPRELSYGHRRLVALARAAATEPSVLLLDEPAAGLSQPESRHLSRLVRRFAVHWRMGVLLVEHDMSLVMSTCDRIAVLDFGTKIAEGKPDEIRSDRGVLEAYLGPTISRSAS